MEALDLARWQFGITTVYHFLFVPLSIGLVYLIAFMQTIYVVKKDDKYKDMAKFWGQLFLLNFAVGVVTGIMQEFQFGMNWADYSRYVGAVFGGPLAVEALVSFFLESTFLGIWIFGWDKLPKKVHLLSIWLVAIGTTLSALWILSANSFMQEPVGYAIRGGRAEMTDFFALLGNAQLWSEFPHVIFGALSTGAMFVTGISAYKLLRKKQTEMFKKSFAIGIVVALVSTIMTAMAGHDQAQHLMKSQPMKMAAAEALWDTTGEHAPWTVFATIDSNGKQNGIQLDIPYALSILSYNKLSGSVPGINQLQKEYEAKYGPGNYVPPVRTTFWSFRIMVVSGVLMILLSLFGTYAVIKDRLEKYRRYLRWMLPAIALPFIANTTGWLMTEVGRQPWIVFGLQKTEDGVSPNVSAGMVWTSLIGFTVIYGILLVVLVYLMSRTVRKEDGTDEHGGHGGPRPAALEAL